MEVMLIVVVLFFLGSIGWGISIFNELIRRRNLYRNSFSQIEVQLKRRYDLIPNLVEVAKKYMAHERETLEAVISARNQAAGGLQRAAEDPGSAEVIQQLAGAEGLLSNAMGRLFALSESYPDLKANQTLMQLSEELSGTENRVAYARQAFNDEVTTYNTYRQSFPAIVVAAAFGHPSDAALLEFDSEQIREVPKVSF